MPKVELLAPAGSYETFKAVLHAGADAVYLAGNKFGARAYANNLSEEELILAIEEAHVYGKRIYLTVNTLCKNQELFGHLYDYMLPLYMAGLDGVIVQDLGVLSFLHDCFPGLELHASTQMTITNSEVIDVLKKYDVTRIVPARELSLQEIKKMHDESGMEIECFVHGALCYCYSGVCFMSSFMGGRSGNRGRCAQPCRLAYEKDGKTSNILSLKDLNTLEILPDLIENGVYSMKIEGRMKSPEYAAGITEIYRKYIDLYLEKGRDGYHVEASDLEHLLWLFDRGGITDGYYHRHNGKQMIANASKADKSQNEKKQYEEGVISRNLKGDYRIPVKIHAYLGTNHETVLTMESLNHPDAFVSVTGEPAQPAMKKAMSEDDIAKQLSKLGNTYFCCEAIEVEMDEALFIPNSTLNELRRQAVSELIDYITKPYKEQRHPAKYEVTNLNTELDGGLAKDDDAANMIQNGFCYSVHCTTKEQVDALFTFLRSTEDLNARLILDSEWMNKNDLVDAARCAKELNVPVYLGLPRILRNGYDQFVYEVLLPLADQVDGYIVRNLGEAQLIKKLAPNAEMILDYTCYAMNDVANEVWSKISDKIVSVNWPIESNAKELSHLHPIHPELFAYGRVPMMVTANCVDMSTNGCHKPKERFAEIIDRKNASLPVLTACRYCYNLILNSVPIYLFDLNSAIDKLHPHYLGIHFTTESYDESYQVLEKAFKGESMPNGSFTRGHFTNGVE